MAPGGSRGQYSTVQEEERRVRRDEMEAAFDLSGDESEEESDEDEAKPLVSQAQRQQQHSRAPSAVEVPSTIIPPVILTTTDVNNSTLTTQTSADGVPAYDFERYDTLDYPPPPGSPPATAFPNNPWGNTNGHVPDFDSSVQRPRGGRYRGWMSRVLPQGISSRLGLHDYGRLADSDGPAGGVGLGSDGVFSNVTAKPSTGVRVQNGDETYIVPEHTLAEAPPSYASAQADAVPPYWETTVHAPFSSSASPFAGGSGDAGEMIVEGMPTGTLFSFLCTMLVSVAFQFVGFLFTYLMHGSHAAKLGSRAGLGVTLIQYGFALRSQIDDSDDILSPGQNASPAWPISSEDPSSSNPWTDPTAIPTDGGANSTVPGMITEEQASMMLADATTEWLAFFLMTVGWFVLLTSVLSFWRVKRWERGILSSQAPAANADGSSSGGGLSQFHRLFARSFHPSSGLNDVDDLDDLESGRRQAEPDEDDETAATMRIIESLPEGDARREELVRILENERRLQHDLREAGLL